MNVILSRDIKNVGKVGEVCEVKTGYGRNFLIPKGYAIVANKKNITSLQEKIEELKQRNSEMLKIAKNVADILNKKVFNIIRAASDDKIIYGSVRNRDIRDLISELLHESRITFSVDIGSIKIAKPIKSLGQYIVSVNVFADVVAKVRLNVCRTSTEFDDDITSFDKKYQEFLQPTNVNGNKTEADSDKNSANTSVVNQENNKENTTTASKNQQEATADKQ